jgi:hypothetical protein
MGFDSKVMAKLEASQKVDVGNRSAEIKRFIGLPNERKCL